MFYRRYGKRLFDLITVFLLTIVLSWVVLLIILIYFLLWEFPIFFRQQRIGKNNLPFEMWKFRTLSTDEHLPTSKRSFALGSFLRYTNLDELPQLWNVLSGEMSLIGPRPLPLEYLPLYSEEQIKRHEVKPGLTGWAQVNGRNSISWKKKFELDIYYVNNISFKLDLIILMKTLVLLVSLQKDVSLAEEKFRGN